MSTSWNRVASTQLYGHCESMLIWHIIKIIMNSPVVIEQIMEPFSSKQPLVYSTTFFILACFCQCLRAEWSNTPSPCCYWWPFRRSTSFAWGSLFCGQERWGIWIKFQQLYQYFYTRELPVDVSNIFPWGLVLCEEKTHGSFKVHQTRIKSSIHFFNKCLCYKQHCSAMFTWKVCCYNAFHHLVNEVLMLTS